MPQFLLPSQFIDSCPQVVAVVSSQSGREVSFGFMGDLYHLTSLQPCLQWPYSPRLLFPGASGCAAACLSVNIWTNTWELLPPLDFQHTLTAGATWCLQKDEQFPDCGVIVLCEPWDWQSCTSQMCACPGTKMAGTARLSHAVGLLPLRLKEELLSASYKLLQLSVTRHREPGLTMWDLIYIQGATVATTDVC